MIKEKTPYNPMPGDYDTEKLTDLHSSETEPSSYARNIDNIANSPRSKDSYNSNDRNIKKSNLMDTTERVPILARYSDMNKDDDDIDYIGKIE